MRSYLLKPPEPSKQLNPQDCVLTLCNAQKVLHNINILVCASLNVRELQCAQLWCAQIQCAQKSIAPAIQYTVYTIF